MIVESQKTQLDSGIEHSMNTIMDTATVWHLDQGEWEVRSL